MVGIKGASGGARPGAGRKRIKKTISEKIQNNYLKAARKIAREKGMTIEEHLLRMLFDSEVQDTVKASIMKSYNEAMIAKTVSQNISVTKDKGMAVRLPPKRQDPALTMVQGGKVGDTKKGS